MESPGEEEDDQAGLYGAPPGSHMVGDDELKDGVSVPIAVRASKANAGMGAARHRLFLFAC